MADADKPEVLRAAGDDSPHQQPVEQPGEPRREPHPPEPEKQPPQHSSSSNGVKMYCLFLRGPGRGGGWGVGLWRAGLCVGGSKPAWASVKDNRPRAVGGGRSRCKPGRSQALPSSTVPGEPGCEPGADAPPLLILPRLRVTPSSQTSAGEPLSKAPRPPRSAGKWSPF